MKNILYKSPIASSIVINSTCCICTISSLNTGNYYLLSSLLVSYFFNKQLLIKGENINKYHKVILALIFFTSIILVFVFNKYTNVFAILKK